MTLGFNWRSWVAGQGRLILARQFSTRLEEKSLPYYSKKFVERSKKSPIKLTLDYKSTNTFQYDVERVINEIQYSDLLFNEPFEPIPSKFTIAELQKAVVISIIYALHYGSLVSSGRLDKEPALKRLECLLVLKKHQFANPNKNPTTIIMTDLFSSIELTHTNIRQETDQLIKSYNNGSIIDEFSPEFFKILENLLTTFYRFESPYNVKDLICWIKSLSCDDVRSSWFIIADFKFPPKFVLLDLLNKKVNSKLEVKVAKEVYKKIFNHIPEFSKQELFLKILEKLQLYDYSQCYEFINFYLSDYKSITMMQEVNDSTPPKIKRQSFLHNVPPSDQIYPPQYIKVSKRNQAINIHLLNCILWKLSINSERFTYYKSLEMIRCQAFVVEYLKKLPKILFQSPNSNRTTFKDQLHPSSLKYCLNILGNTALIKNLYNKEPSKSKEYLKSIDKQLFKLFIKYLNKGTYGLVSSDTSKNSNGLLSHNSIKHIILQYFEVRFLVCDSKDELQQAFKDAMIFPAQYGYEVSLNISLKNTALIWRFYVSRLIRLKLVDGETVTMIIEKILNKEIHLSYNSLPLVDFLINKSHDFQLLQKLIEYVSSLGLLTSSITQSYLVRLYRANVHNVLQNIFNSQESNNNRQDLLKFLKLFLNPLTRYHGLQNVNKTLLNNHTNLLSFTRSIFNSLRDPNASTIGQVIYYEAFIDSQLCVNLYKHYKVAVKADIFSLKGLLLASLISKDDSIILYAIKEFQNLISKSFTNPSPILLMADDSAWLLYIKVLHTYNAQEDLKRVINWWEEVRYIPSQMLLTNLLCYLPDDQGERLRSYGYRTLKGNVHFQVNEPLEEGMLEYLKDDKTLKDLGLEPRVYDNNNDNMIKKSKEIKVEETAFGTYVPIQYEYSTQIWPWPTREFMMATMKNN